jgi:serine/threonine-protein kinase RsbW
MTDPPDRSGPGFRGTFDGGRLTSVRHIVAGCATTSGLRCARLEDFVLAVSEIMTNVVRHGGGTGSIALSIADHVLTCVITDQGSGVPAHFLSERPLPATAEPGGRGLLVARRLCDDMTVTTGRAGTTVRLVMSVPDGHSTAGIVVVGDDPPTVTRLSSVSGTVELSP